MKNYFILAFSLLLSITGLQAQDILERSFEFDKRVSAQANGIVYKVNVPKVIIDRAIEKKFAEIKSKSKNMRKDLIVFEACSLPDISPQTMDYYFRVKEVSPQKSEIQMFISLGNDNFISGDKYQKEIAAAGDFLKGLAKEGRVIQLQAEITRQIKVVDMEQERQNLLNKESKHLGDEIVKLQKEIADNKAKQEKIAKDKEVLVTQLKLETEKLEALRSQLEEIQN